MSASCRRDAQGLIRGAYESVRVLRRASWGTQAQAGAALDGRVTNVVPPETPFVDLDSFKPLLKLFSYEFLRSPQQNIKFALCTG